MVLNNWIHVLECSSYTAALKYLSSTFLNYLLNEIDVVAFYNTEGQILTFPSFPAKKVYINACKK